MTLYTLRVGPASDMITRLSNQDQEPFRGPPLQSKASTQNKSQLRRNDRNPDVT